MRYLLLLLVVAGFGNVVMAADTSAKELASLKVKVNSLTQQLNAQQKLLMAQHTEVGTLARQLMVQQLFLEERIRSDGDSGLKQVRHVQEGTRPYHSSTYATGSVAAIHDHSNYIQTVGMGEYIAVINGVEFRTRHNDYQLRMPHRTSKNYHAVENVPLPAVPPAVLAKKTVQEQIVEMREWFKAWRDGNYKTRDYRKYFKPVLCYLEGAWHADTTKLEDPFFSERHRIDATTWMDLQQKIRFTSFSGRKHPNENHAFLPTTVLDVVNGTPIYAQWNYRILCHPLSRDIPLNRFRVIDDLANRMAYRRPLDVHRTQRAARFQLNPFDRDTWLTYERHIGYGLIDKLMEEIPGKDNYAGKLTDDAMFYPAQSLAKGNPVINAARYHRWYKTGKRGAMGLTVRHRGFSDENLFTAMTTQPKIGSMKYTDCEYISGKGRQCNTWEQRWTYAIPLEIVYLTPLSNWNPYDIKYKGLRSSRNKDSLTVYAGGRNGNTKDPAKAYNGTNSAYYYRTPQEFYTGKEVGKDAADTSRGTVGVLDQEGNVRLVRASGIRIFMPNIPGVGVLRQRFPIMPIHQDGDAVMKEVQALKDIVMHQQTYATMMDERPVATSITPGQKLQKETELEMSTAYTTGEHTHTVSLQPDEIEKLITGTKLTIDTSLDNAHSHRLRVYYNKTSKKFYYDMCDGKFSVCWDGHAKNMYIRG